MELETGDCNRKIIKIAADGSVTLSMPEVAGQYLVIEQEQGRVILQPFDLRWSTPTSTIAKIGSRMHLGPLPSGQLPEA